MRNTRDTRMIPLRNIKRQGLLYSCFECLEIEPTDILASTWHNLDRRHQSTKEQIIKLSVQGSK